MASLINPLKSDSKETRVQIEAKANFVIQEGADISKNPDSSQTDQCLPSIKKFSKNFEYLIKFGLELEILAKSVYFDLKNRIKTY